MPYVVPATASRIIQVSFEKHGKLTRRAAFLAEMEEVVPWRELCAVVEPFYPKRGNGRPPIGVERMLRLHFLQHWFNLSDPAVEEALYESVSMRRFVGIDLGREPVPDETTILNSPSGRAIRSAPISRCRRGRSTKNQAKARDPDMHQTGKGQQWYFGMKLHIGVDSKTKMIHSMEDTTANDYDAKLLAGLLHGDETRVYGDQAYRGQK